MNLCWWCCHEIPGDIFEFPYKYTNNTFYLCGQFCSWSCIKAHNINSRSYMVGARVDLISLYRLKTTGELNPITSAPPRFALKAFGGTLTIEEFRANKNGVKIWRPDDSFIKLVNVPRVTVGVVVEDNSNELVLKRNKPLKRDTSGIQKLLLKK